MLCWPPSNQQRVKSGCQKIIYKIKKSMLIDCGDGGGGGFDDDDDDDDQHHHHWVFVLVGSIKYKH